MTVTEGDMVAPFFGMIGVASALALCCFGAGYGTAKCALGVSAAGVMRPQGIMRSMIAPIMAGIVGIYGLIISVVVSTFISDPSNGKYTQYLGFCHLGSGLCCGFAGLASGMSIGIIGDAGVRATVNQPKMFVGMVLMLIFAEAIGLYGLIVGLLVAVK